MAGTRAEKRNSHRVRFHILTIFPKIFDSYLNESLIKRARLRGILDVRVHNLRDFAEGRHRKVDDRVFGGGPGMVMQVGPIYRAVRFLAKGKAQRAKGKTRTILFSTRGRMFDAKTAKRLAKYDELILICGRYEGVDERVAEHVAEEEISMGDYVLSGGEIPALALIEAISRFVPGFLGKKESLEELHGSHPVYTRPEVFTAKGKGKRERGKQRSWRVPKVLLSGNHKSIEAWRKKC